MRQAIRVGDHRIPTFAVGLPFQVRDFAGDAVWGRRSGAFRKTRRVAGSITECFVLTLALLWCAPRPVLAQAPTGVVAQVDERAEVAAALYSASATQAAAERVADAKMQAQRTEIERLRAQVRAGAAGAAQLQAALTAAQEAYVAALAARDRAYAQEIAVFRGGGPGHCVNP